jgi:phosphoribosyl 1,2-cyclic phosphate phosphodiesterase
MKLRAIILGCGSSGGVPRIGGEDGAGDWGACDPSEPKNRRSRCSIVVQRADDQGSFDGDVTTVLIDTSPDMREQLIRNRIRTLHGVLITHDHADQTHGIDDLRVVALQRRERVPVWVDRETAPELIRRFGYCFEQPENSGYPAVLDECPMPSPGTDFEIDGPTGPIPVVPFLQKHGRIDSLGFRCGPITYSADLDDLYEESWTTVDGTSAWIIDALQYKRHSSHLHLDKALAFLERARASRGILTNLHVVMDYATLRDEVPEEVEPAFDGMIVEVG